MKTSKSAQMKINEMIIMILAIFIFFVIVLLFWLSISTSGIKASVAQSSRDQAIMLVARLADSPEFGCGGIASSCIDTDKLIVLMNHPVYKNFWNVDGLIVEKVTNTNSSVECSIGNYPRCTIFTIKKPLNDTIPDSSIVSLCRKEIKKDGNYDKCEIGKITVWTER